MAFDVKIQTNTSEKNALTKTITTLTTLSGVLRAETSIINPVIQISGNIDNLINCNYITIPSFGRSYFVTNIRSIHNNLVEITGHVDVLSSFKASILENKAIVKRQEQNWNLYLNDGIFKVYQNPLVLTKSFPQGFTGNSYVLVVAGA